MTHLLELPSDSVFENVIAHLDTQSMLAVCQEQLNEVDAAIRCEWKQCRVVEALYHPGRYIRVAYAFLTDPSIPNHTYGLGRTSFMSTHRFVLRCHGEEAC